MSGAAWKRRHKRRTPFHTLRVNSAWAAAPAGADAGDFPGQVAPAARGRARAFTILISLLFHGLLIGGIALAAARAPEEEESEFVINLTPLPRNQAAPASRPKIIAERSRSFRRTAAAPVAVAPIRRPQAPRLTAPAKIDVAAIRRPSLTPTDVQRSKVAEAKRVAAADLSEQTPTRIDNLAPTTARSVEAPEVDLGEDTAPVDFASAARAEYEGEIVQSLDVGGAPQVMGLLTGRNIPGAASGRRLTAAVGWSLGPVGQGAASGGPGKSTACGERIEVQSYLGKIRDKVEGRWSEGQAQTSHTTTLAFRVSAAGAVARMNIASRDIPGARYDESELGHELDRHALSTMRAAAPFDVMPENARCLTEIKGDIHLTFFLNP